MTYPSDPALERVDLPTDDPGNELWVLRVHATDLLEALGLGGTLELLNTFLKYRPGAPVLQAAQNPDIPCEGDPNQVVVEEWALDATAKLILDSFPLPLIVEGIQEIIFNKTKIPVQITGVQE